MPEIKISELIKGHKTCSFIGNTLLIARWAKRKNHTQLKQICGESYSLVKNILKSNFKYCDESVGDNVMINDISIDKYNVVI